MDGVPLGSVAAHAMIERIDEERGMAPPRQCEMEGRAELDPCPRCEGYGTEPDGTNCEACLGEGEL